MADVFKLHLPTILNSDAAKKSWTKVMNGATQNNEMYVVTGTSRKAVVVIGVDQFREMHDSYEALLEELEARRALDKEGTKEALERLSEEELPQSEDEFVTASKVEERQPAEFR